MSAYRKWSDRMPRANNPQSPWFVDEDERDAEQELQDRLDEERNENQDDEMESE